MSTEPSIALVILGLIVAGAVYYQVRARQLRARGYDLKLNLTQLHDHEAVRSGTAVTPEAGPGDVPAEQVDAPEATAPEGGVAILTDATTTGRGPEGEPTPPTGVEVLRPPPRARVNPPPSRAEAGPEATASDADSVTADAGAGTGATSSSAEPPELSELPDVAGLGPARRQALLDHFGSVDAVAAATIEELTAVEGVGRRLAERVHGALRGDEA